MKKYYSFIALAALALASCTSDEFVGGNEKVTTESKGNAIGFDFGVPNLTRGSLSGADAAEALNYQFVVYGTKHTEEEVEAATNDEVVFSNYKVEWTDNSAGTTESNTHNWEYVGLTPYTEGVSPVVESQTIKYWDYSATNGYTFYAFAGKDQLTAKNVTVTKITEGTNSLYEKGYTVTIKDAAAVDLNKLYYSDRTPVAKSEYGKPVVLTFRNLGSRVRVGFYETVPGYSVKINKFYYDEDATAAVTTFKAMEDEETSKFTAALQNVAPVDNNSLTITYYDGNDGTENHVKVTNTGMVYGYNLTLGTGIISAEKLATTSATPTWDNEGNYTTVYPFEQNTNPMLIRVDYTLTAEDGSEETIEVKNARVVVPTNFVQWKSNYAYTYLFKISNNTNGTTGKVPTDPDDPTPEDGDPEGLFPITFDAVAVTATDYTQETITTVATNNVTTYAVNSDVTTVGEYKAGETIYVVDENTFTHEPLTVSGIGVTAGNATVYTATTTGDAISEATVLAMLNGAPNGITLTAANPAATVVTEANSIPQADGSTYTLAANKAVQFTPAAAGTYVYVYTNTAYVATEYEAAGDTFDTAETYYFKTDKDVYYAASGLSTNNFDKYKADLWKVKTDGTVGVYDIKVIIIK